MKSINVFALSLTLFIFFGCAPDKPLQNGTNPAAVALADAAAAVEVYLTLSEACPICATTPQGQTGVAIATVILAADASGVFGRSANHQFTNGKNRDIDLPIEFVIPNNPFEELGKEHNIALNYLNLKDSLLYEVDRINNYNFTSWFDIMNHVYPNYDDVVKDNAFNVVYSSNVIAELKNRYAISDQYQPFDFDKYLQNSLFSNSSRERIHVIVSQYTSLLSETNVGNQVFEYLDSEIENILQSKSDYTEEEKAMLIFLSILKHSTFYWNS